MMNVAEAERQEMMHVEAAEMRSATQLQRLTGNCTPAAMGFRCKSAAEDLQMLSALACAAVRTCRVFDDWAQLGLQARHQVAQRISGKLF